MDINQATSNIQQIYFTPVHQ